MPDERKQLYGWIQERMEAAVTVQRRLLKDSLLMETLIGVIQKTIASFRGGGKVLLCGNGGSAADAQHIAAELSGKFYKKRPPLFAEALHVNTSYLTAVGNDYSFEEIFSRLVEAQGKKGDILIGLSTSGNSKNVVRAIQKASALGMITVGFTGENPGKMGELCQHLLKVPSKDTPRIQESHILLGHVLCEAVEKALF